MRGLVWISGTGRFWPAESRPHGIAIFVNVVYKRTNALLLLWNADSVASPSSSYSTFSPEFVQAASPWYQTRSPWKLQHVQNGLQSRWRFLT